MEKKNKFEIQLQPLNEVQNNSNNKEQKNNVNHKRELVRSQYKELMTYQDIELNSENKDDFERIIMASEDLISNCMEDNAYSGNRDSNYIDLVFITHKLSLKLEAYKNEEKIKEIEKRNNIIAEKQEKYEEQSNNLIYNLLGFLASFSIISASVEAISRINGIINIMLFMLFAILLLLTALIGLHNFYKNTSIRSKLQDNYFLWKIVLIVIIALLIVEGFLYLNENRDKLRDFFDVRIEKIIDKKLEERERTD